MRLRFNMRVPRLFHDTLLARPAFVAPDRAGRPGDFDGATPLGGPDRCPFCAGNEPLTPPEVLRSPAAEPGLPGGGPWRARIVPNRFPFVVTDADAAAAATAAGGGTVARGIHDVVVESPDHVESILAVAPAAWREVWLLCRERMALLAGRDDVAWATLFKNSGAAAGASLEHVHSQLVALDFVPPTILAEIEAARRPTDPFADMIARAEADGRIVAALAGGSGGTEDGLVAIVPPAPRQPFETWILPRAATPHLHAASAGAVVALADLTHGFVDRLERLVPGANYNWWLHQPPFPGRHAAAHAAAAPQRTTSGSTPLPARYRWHLEIVPRINGLAGFELGTGCHVTTLAPEECARLLRAE